MFSAKFLSAVLLVCASAVASAQINSGPQPRSPLAHKPIPCRLKPALYRNPFTNAMDYGAALILVSTPRPATDKAIAEQTYTKLLNNRTCMPPKQPLRCVIVGVGFRHGIEVIHPDGRRDAPIINDIGQTPPEQALSNYLRAGICTT